MKRVCVFAGSNPGLHADYSAVAQELGRVLAERGIGIVYGGGRIGLMGALADAALGAGGHVTGVIPSALVAKEVAHNRLSDLRVVSSMHERKATMVELADAFIALPGGFGTLEELFEVVTWAQLGIHRKPCGLLNVQGYFDRLLSFLAHAIDEGFLDPQHASVLSVSPSPSALLDKLTTSRPPAVDKLIDLAST